jgi:hypothetical protein
LTDQAKGGGGAGLRVDQAGRHGAERGKGKGGRQTGGKGKGRGLCGSVERGSIREKKSPARGGACKGGRAGLHAGGGVNAGQRLDFITPSRGSCKR